MYGQEIDLTEEEMIQLDRVLKRFGPGDNGARDVARRYASGVYQGDVVIFDHLFTPAKHVSLPIDLRNEKDAAFVANALNCSLEVRRGMDVAGLNELCFIALGEARTSLRRAILNYLAGGTFEVPETQVAI